MTMAPNLVGERRFQFVSHFLLLSVIALSLSALNLVRANASVTVYWSPTSMATMTTTGLATTTALTDNSVGDTTTGVTGTGSYSSAITAIYDLGTATTVSKFECVCPGSNGGQLYYSNSANASSWTSVSGPYFGSPGTNTLSPSVSARYWCFSSSTGSSSISITDFRLYDSSGVLINPGVTGPSAPTSLTATGGTSRLINLAWTAPSGSGLTYSVFRGVTSGAENTTAIASGIATTSYADTSVNNATIYYYKVEAVNSAGPSPYSNEASATSGISLASPTTVTIYNGDAHSLLAWSSVSGATSYNVYRALGSGSFSKVASNVTSTSTITGSSALVCVDGSLTNGSTYSYEIASVNTSGEGPLGTAFLAYPTNTGLPAAPAFPTASAVSGGVTMLAAGGSAIYYQATTSGGETVPIAQFGGGGAPGVISGTVSSLTNGTTYYFQLSVLGTNSVSGNRAESERSPEVSATPGSTLLSAPTVTVNVNGMSPVLTWTAVSGATSYDIFSLTLTNHYNFVVAYVPSGTTTWSDPTEGYGPNFTYNVAAVSTNGTGNLSSTVNGALKGFGVTAAPSSITIARGSSGVVAIQEPACNSYWQSIEPAFTGPISLSGSGLPSGVTAWCTPSYSVVPAYVQGVLLANYSNGTYLTISVPLTAATGTYPITLTGTATVLSGASYAFTQAATLTLIVQ